MSTVKDEDPDWAFAVVHVNTTTRAMQIAHVMAGDMAAMLRLLNAISHEDPAYGEDGVVTFQVPYGHITLIPVKEV